MADLNRALAMAVKTGKVLFGANSTLKGAMTGKVQLIVAASNCPEKLRANLEYYCKLSKVPFVIYPRTSLELGRVCGKPFIVSALTIRDPGDSDILKTAVKNGV
ncbi:MAG: 50S ribosomal protein L30e [Candidatus Bathyarchaeota archaeon]|nr:50S ribosomal protein L30e [Candidatus Bathyarchaeota archaeon]